MNEEVKEHLEVISKLLNGQIRGAINKKAREENLEFIKLTLSNIWNQGYEFALNEIKDVEILEKLKKELKDDNNGPKG